MESIIKKLKIKNIFDYIQEEEKEKIKNVLPIRIFGNKNDLNFIICSCGSIRKNHNSHCLACKQTHQSFPIDGTYTQLKKLNRDTFFHAVPLIYKRDETKQSFLFCTGEIILDVENLEKTSFEKLMINKVDVYIENKELVFYLNDKKSSFLDIVYSVKYIEKTTFINALIRQTENINKTVRKENQIDWFILPEYNSSAEYRISFIQKMINSIILNKKSLKVLSNKFSNNVENYYNYEYNKIIALVKEFKKDEDDIDLLYSDSFYEEYFYTNSAIEFVKILKKLKNKKYEESILANYLSYFGEEYSDSYPDLLKIILYNKDVDKNQLKEYIEHIKENEAKDRFLTIYTYACYLQKRKKIENIYPVDLFLTERTMRKGVK